MWLQDYMVALCLVFWETSIQFSIVVAPIYIPTNGVEGFRFLHVMLLRQEWRISLFSLVSVSVLRTNQSPQKVCPSVLILLILQCKQLWGSISNCHLLTCFGIDEGMNVCREGFVSRRGGTVWNCWYLGMSVKSGVRVSPDQEGDDGKPRCRGFHNWRLHCPGHGGRGGHQGGPF